MLELILSHLDLGVTPISASLNTAKSNNFSLTKIKY